MSRQSPSLVISLTSTPQSAGLSQASRGYLLLHEAFAAFLRAQEQRRKHQSAVRKK